jgi:hypothetical protein
MAESGKKTATRKEKRKAELSARLDATLKKLEVVAQRPTEDLSRHDPKHTTGTFWKERKEKKKRTLFFGGLHANATSSEIRELIESVEGAENGVESVDIVGQAKMMRFAKSTNAFVLFTTREAAFAAQQALDGFAISAASKLRVNFSDDHSQRAVAIEKRSVPAKRAARGNFTRRQRG